MYEDGKILDGYDFDTEYVVPLGRDVQTGHGVQLSLGMMNRHGYMAGATGTGKTRTLQAIIEWASSQGVSCVASDGKGDLSGLAKRGHLAGKALERARTLGQTDCENAWWAPTDLNVEFLALAGIGMGASVHIPIGTFGYRSLSRMVRLTADQTNALGSAYLASKNESAGALETIDDLCAFLRGVGNDPDSGVSEAVVSRTINKFRIFDADNPGLFDGCEFDVMDLIAQDADGWGRVSIIDNSQLADHPDILTTFLLWAMERLAKQLPEVGDQDTPKLIIFLDEAHLLFHEAPKEFIVGLTRTIKVLRSKGVGVFFISQKAEDIHENVLAQCANRIQHALRANTPKERRELKNTVDTFPVSSVYVIERELTEMRTGEALVCVMDDEGRPTPPSVCMMYVPRTSMTPMDDEEIMMYVRKSPLYQKYRDLVRDYREEKRQRRNAPTPNVIMRPEPQDAVTADVGGPSALESIRGLLGRVARSHDDDEETVTVTPAEDFGPWGN